MHEVIREHSVEAAKEVKMKGRPNDLIDRLAADGRLPLDREALESIACDPAKFVGRAEQQVEDFLKTTVRPRLAEWQDLLKETQASRVKV
jgi:adenylosuccinate lyase